MRLFLTIVAVVAAVWLIPLFLSVESGLRFGWPYRVLFILVILFSGFLFYLLRTPAMPPLRSTRRALAGLVLVFVVSIGAIVALANLAPQFAFKGAGSVGATAQERGKALFNNPNVGCFLCHTVAGSGGTRGPDLSHITTIAGNRRPGMSAEDYLRESLLNPSVFVVSPYDNIMPPIAQRLSLEELGDLIAYLKGLK